MESKSGLEIAMAVFAIFFYLFILCTAVWGYGTLTSDCKNSQLRLALRGLMVLGAIGLTAFIGYVLCHLKCEPHTSIKLGHIPTWLFVFIFCSAVVAMAFQIMVQQALDSGSEDDKKCQNSDYFSKFNTAGIVGSVLVIILLLLALWFRAKKSKQEYAGIKAEREKKKQEEKRKKETEEAQKKSKELMEATRQLQEHKQAQEALKKLQEQEAQLKASQNPTIVELQKAEADRLEKENTRIQEAKRIAEKLEVAKKARQELEKAPQVNLLEERKKQVEQKEAEVLRLKNEKLLKARDEKAGEELRQYQAQIQVQKKVKREKKKQEVKEPPIPELDNTAIQAQPSMFQSAPTTPTPVLGALGAEFNPGRQTPEDVRSQMRQGMAGQFGFVKHNK